MKDEILSEIRSFVFPKTSMKVSEMLDRYKAMVEEACSKPKSTGKNEALLKDQVEHLMRALDMISRVPASSEGSTMARDIASEAMSTVTEHD